jgi:periplasmic divalent cation tolerance protein
MDENDENVTASSNVGEEEKIPPTNEDVVLIYTTFPSLGEAEDAARELVNAKLAACVNILPSMVSVYTWQGKTETANEVAMLVKSAKVRTDDVLNAIKRMHPYDVPARLVLPVTGGGADFLRWIVTGSTPPTE